MLTLELLFFADAIWARSMSQTITTPTALTQSTKISVSVTKTAHDVVASNSFPLEDLYLNHKKDLINDALPRHLAIRSDPRTGLPSYPPLGYKSRSSVITSYETNVIIGPRSSGDSTYEFTESYAYWGLVSDAVKAAATSTTDQTTLVHSSTTVRSPSPSPSDVSHRSLVVSTATQTTTGISTFNVVTTSKPSEGLLGSIPVTQTYTTSTLTSSASTTSMPLAAPKSSLNLPLVAYIGIGIGVTCLVPAVAAFLVCLCVKRRRRIQDRASMAISVPELPANNDTRPMEFLQVPPQVYIPNGAGTFNSTLPIPVTVEPGSCNNSVGGSLDKRVIIDGKGVGSVSEEEGSRRTAGDVHVQKVTETELAEVEGGERALELPGGGVVEIG